jgi:hypothetical protein
MVSRLLIRIELVVFSLIISLLFSGSTLVVTGQNAKLRLFTRALEFDYFDWTLDALGIKISQSSLSSPFYFSEIDQHLIVLDYIDLVDEITQQENLLKLIFSDPGVQDPFLQSQEKRDNLENLYDSQYRLAPIAEAILERQISEILQAQGVTLLGLPIPPVLFHISPLPNNIVISPRDNIQQSNSISLVSDLPVNEQVELENKIDNVLNVSSLVVPVGGIGSYPTMIERSSSLVWISNTIAHEWIHNWLSFRPLGLRYGLNNEMRTMNETTASLVGDEIGKNLIGRFYPELTLEVKGNQFVNIQTGRPDPNDLPMVQFDFRSEMHLTRVKVDKLLAEGKIDAAESYMESRRQIFWNNGYAIRKLNQAYFAFYGAYADIPGGAAGEDPVGPAVRTLRAQSPTLRAFLEKISKMTSFEELIVAISN